MAERKDSRAPVVRRASIIREVHSDRLGWVLAGVMFAGYTAFSVWQWRNFAAPSWDLGIFTQLLERYRTLSEPIVQIKGPGYNLWGDHFHPILVLLTPLYALFPSGLTLMVA
ncbi:putative membrane protein [Trueperella bonasi]|uniref:Membrane protein n=1 Tax=Trueperella bonasi TaxID=312286 RepID=A0ABT9NGF1_9ACTO|nr:putative membrane protein [Trueperella bonasi]